MLHGVGGYCCPWCNGKEELRRAEKSEKLVCLVNGHFLNNLEMKLVMGRS